MSALAPLAVFVFRRPEHTARMLEALARCPELTDTPLYIFADGPRADHDVPSVNTVRAVVKAFAHQQKTLVFSERNQGLARSILSGVTRLCREHGRVIVLEDDLLVSPAFLTYMNDALRQYAEEERVWCVNAFSFGDLSAVSGSRGFFLPYAHPWGWATWWRAWSRFDPDDTYLERVTSDPETAFAFNFRGADDYVRMLRLQARGEIDSWWIRWYASLLLNDAMGVFPPVALIRSIGSDRSATHRQLSERLLQSRQAEYSAVAPRLPDEVTVSNECYLAFRKAMRPTLRRAMRLASGILHALRSRTARA